MTRSRPLSDVLGATPLFFEPAPPPARTSAARVEERLDAVAALVRSVERVDALDIPELVDENHEGKPHYRSGDLRGYARSLQERTDRPAVLNKVVAYLENTEALGTWGRETVAAGLHHAVLVGGASRYIPYPGPPVVEANGVCRPIFRAVGGLLGNIAIPQRVGEPHRLLAKTRAGASFFTTQLVFDADQTIQMVRQYDLLCRQASIPPSAILLSFAPIADEADIEFVRWLGADLPEAAERMILEGNDAEAARRSGERALEVWESVARSARSDELAVPLGVNVEQVSARHLDPAADLLREFARRLPNVRRATGGAAGSGELGPAEPPTSTRVGSGARP